MIDLNAALCHHLFELPIADWIGHIPSDAPQDDITLELAAFEIDHGRRTGRLLPVSLRALGKVSKFATEPKIAPTRSRENFATEPDNLNSAFEVPRKRRGCDRRRVSYFCGDDTASL